MTLENSRLLAASLAAAVLGASCSTPTETPPEDPKQQQPGTPPAAQDPLQQPGMQEQVRDERRKALVDNYLQSAKALRSNGDLQAAKFQLLRAKELSPGNQEVLSLLASVQAELGEPAGRVVTYAEEQMRVQQIAEERARATVESHLQKAQQAMTQRNFAGAIEELRIAALTIEVKEGMEWQDLPQQVQAAKADAERQYDEQQRQSQAALSAQQAEQLKRQHAEDQARKRGAVDSLIQQSQIAFEARQFQRSQELAQRAHQLEPQNQLAYEMHNAAVKAARDTVSDDYIRNRALAMRKMMEADEELKVPQNDVLVMDYATWDKAQRRAMFDAAGIAISPEDEALREKVATTQVGRLSYTEETGDFLEVVKQLNVNTRVTIIVTPEAREIITGESLKLNIQLVTSVTLDNFLDHMIGRSANLAWTIRDGVVVIGNKSQAAGTIVNRIYPVKDLVFKQTQFLPPRVQTIPGEGTDDTPRTGSEGEDPVAGIELADLVTTLKEATDPKYWETDGVGITAEESGLLSVKASPSMQDQVVGVLRDMRRFQTPIVTVDSKFLTISRNFLQEIGVDFRGLGGSGQKGTIATLDDLTNGLDDNTSRGLDNGGTGDPAANPLSGAFYTDGGDGDIRGRTENFFTSGLGKVLSPTGGLTAGWTLIDDTEINMILRAVEKRQDGELVNSQILSVVNKGRGHVAVINQTAYIRDFDVEVAQAAFIADPKVDVIQDGIVLDVQPVILNDRKYIILNLNPTVAELQRPIATFTTSLAGSTLPVTLQLPNLTVTNFSTTVKVPDGGTVLLGGLRQVLTKERRAEIPLLSQLPLISFLFKQEGSVDENRSLMVMVRAQITDIVQDQSSGANGMTPLSRN